MPMLSEIMEVPIGTRVWAMLKLQSGIPVQVLLEGVNEWVDVINLEVINVAHVRFRVKPPGPTRIEPFTAEWAIIQWLRGKTIWCPASDGAKHLTRLQKPETYFSADELKATDWEIVGK